jgi:hypothetical protein
VPCGSPSRDGRTRALRSLRGYPLARWNRPAWVASYGVALFAFVHLLLRPGAKAQSGSRS